MPMKTKILSILIASLFFSAGFFGPAQAETLTAEPDIRVGLFEATNWVRVSVNSTYQIVNANGKVLKTTKYPDKSVRLKYQDGRYLVRRGRFSKDAKYYLRLIPTDPAAIITITNYENRPSWNLSLNDNQFRGRLEIRWAEATQKTWIINELPLEYYLRGVCEAGDTNPAAYLKTLYTAARTYAAYHYLHPTKHDEENYLLDTTANDQVYCGYGFEQRAPNITAAIAATRGQFVTYQGDIVVTPYFSQSDGRTRSWSEVWSGDYPYLISVADPGCAGDSLLGHGVGLSAKGARYFANEKNWGWKKILQYYYTGIAITPLYE